ncbi:MAG: hypothetical protein HON23_04685 [Rickettsiales bacterium]|nr:hypothetical protein [Rickettsiales bacterium]
MTTDVYSTLLEILSLASPEMLKDHVAERQRSGELGAIMSEVLTSWIGNVGSDDFEVMRDANSNLSALSALTRGVKIDDMDKLVKSLSEPSVLGNIEAMVKKSGPEFVESLDIESNPQHAFGLLLMMNIVSIECEKEILLAVSSANLEALLRDPELKALFRYTLEHYMEAIGKEDDLEVQTLLASASLARAEAREEEVREDKGGEYMSDIDILMERIANNQISTTELNFAVGMMPLLALTIAQNFSQLPNTVQSNLAANVFPNLGNTPLGQLCNDIIESRTAFDVKLPNEDLKGINTVVSEDLDKVIKKANTKTQAVKEDLKDGKIDKETAKAEVDIAVKPVQEVATRDAKVSVDAIVAAKPKEMKIQDVEPDELISSSAIPIADEVLGQEKDAVEHFLP